LKAIDFNQARDCILLRSRYSDGSMASLKQRLMLRSVNVWPPLAAAGIHVRWGLDMKSADVEMNLRPWYRNLVGTHHGGPLYSMTDPFYMLMLIGNLGDDHIVWDKTIRFRKPRKGKVRVEFRLTDAYLGNVLSCWRMSSSCRGVQPSPIAKVVSILPP